MAAQHGFDFARLDTEAAHLDLLIVAAHEFDVAVPIEAGRSPVRYSTRSASPVAYGFGTKRSALSSGRFR